MAARETFAISGEVRSLSRKERKASEMIFAIFLAVKTDPLYQHNEKYYISSIRELISLLGDDHFVYLLQNTYLSAWDMIFDASCEILHLKQQYSVYYKLQKALKHLPTHTNQLRFALFQTNTEK